MTPQMARPARRGAVFPVYSASAITRGYRAKAARVRGIGVGRARPAAAKRTPFSCATRNRHVHDFRVSLAVEGESVPEMGARGSAPVPVRPDLRDASIHLLLTTLGKECRALLPLEGSLTVPPPDGGIVDRFSQRLVRLAGQDVFNRNRPMRADLAHRPRCLANPIGLLRVHATIAQVHIDRHVDRRKMVLVLDRRNERSAVTVKPRANVRSGGVAERLPCVVSG